MVNNNLKIYCVLVTYNRIEKLKKAINTYFLQTRLPDKMIIIDNCSTDGTDEYLNALKGNAPFDVQIIRTDKNLGGSGGFYLGLLETIKQDCDWIYVSDDDAYLEETVIENIEKKIQLSNEEVGAICTSIYEQGKIATLHRRVYDKSFFLVKEKCIPEKEYEKESIQLSTFSYVGTAINRSALLQIGLPNKDFFIWYDDTEHGIRMSKRYKILMYPYIKVIHDVEEDNTTISWKKYYGYRNYLYLLSYNYNNKYVRNQILFWKLTYVRDAVLNRRVVTDMKKAAIRDFKNHKCGVSEQYRPGKKLQ